MKHTLAKMIAVFFVVSILLAGCGQSRGDSVRVATDATWPPFEMISDETQELVGFDIDLMNAVAKKAGFEIDYINISFDPLLAGMAQCQYDAAISALTITPDREQVFAFSDPYFAAGQIVVVRIDNMEITGPDTLTGKVVGVLMDSTGDLEAQKIDGAIIQRYDDIGMAFQDLMNGQIESVIVDNPLALGTVGEYPELLKTAGEIFTDEYYGIAVCKTNSELVERINTALAELIDEGYIDQLTETWIVGGGQ